MKRKLLFVPFGDSDKMPVGDTVIAIGSPFWSNSVLAPRITSADILESPFDDDIQTDAATNHGNSGGPLFNLAGEVIGHEQCDIRTWPPVGPGLASSSPLTPSPSLSI